MNFNIFDANGDFLTALSDGASVDVDLIKRAGKIMIIKTEIPYAGTASYWTPDQGIFAAMILPWRAENLCGANRNFPMWVQLDQESRSCGAVAITDCLDDCRINVAMNQETGNCEVTFTLAVCPDTEPFKVWSAADGVPLQEVVDSYRREIAPEMPAVYPDAAWEPVYCSWYAVHAALTSDYLRTNGKIARDLGFGTFIVDDGWCIDDMKRVNPDTIKNWYNCIGDWAISNKKLPEMKEVVQEAKEAGWKYLFWTAPLMAGKDSKLYASLQNFKGELHEGYQLIDPADKDARAKVVKSIVEVMKEQDLDGLKIDFIDELRPNPEKPICRDTLDYVREVVGAIREVRSDALIEFRLKYAVPQLAGYATAFRAGDVPFAFVQNYLCCLHLRVMLGDGIPVHADPVYFRNEDTPLTVSRHMMCSLAGVPMLSMELTTLPEDARRIVKHWLEVYRQWQPVLNFGKWVIRPVFSFVPWCRCTAEQGSVVFIWKKEYLETALAGLRGKVLLLNISDENICIDGATGADCFGNPLGFAPPGGSLTVDI